MKMEACKVIIGRRARPEWSLILALLCVAALLQVELSRGDVGAPAPAPATPIGASGPIDAGAPAGSCSSGICTDPTLCCSKSNYCGTNASYCGDGCLGGPCTPKSGAEASTSSAAAFAGFAAAAAAGTIIFYGAKLATAELHL